MEGEVAEICLEMVPVTHGYPLTLNKAQQEKLQLPACGSRMVSMPGGSLETCLIAGPVEARFDGRSTTCYAVITPDPIPLSINLWFASNEPVKIPGIRFLE